MLGKDKKYNPEELEYFKRKFPQMDKQLFENFIKTCVEFGGILGSLDYYLSLFGLSHGRYLILIHLMKEYESGGLAPGELASGIGVKSASITGLVDNLERDGLVQRQRDTEDRRKVNVHLTEKGHGFLMKFLPFHQENVQSFMSSFKRDDLIRLHSMLDSFRSAINDRIAELEADVENLNTLFHESE